MEKADYETRIFAEVNVEQEQPGSWYREKLYFAPSIRNQSLPVFVKGHLLGDKELVLYHSTIKIRDLFLHHSYEDDVSVESMLVNSRIILSSFGMPKRPVSGGAVGKVSPDEFARIDNCIQNVVGAAGVMYEDNLHGSPSETVPEIYGDEDEVKGVWAKYIKKAPAARLRHIKTIDLGSGNCKGVVEEKSCMYLCLSKAVLGSEDYYWRLRMAAAYTLYALSNMRPTHPLLDDKIKLSMFLYELDDIAADDDTVSEGGTPSKRHNDPKQQMLASMRKVAAKIITGKTDAGQLELNLLLYLLNGVQVCAFQAFTQSMKPRPRDKDKRRNWTLNLLQLGNGKGVFKAMEDHGRGNDDNSSDDIVIWVHVEGQHYITMEFTDVPESRNTVTGKFPEFTIQYDKFIPEEETLIDVDKKLEKFLRQELKERTKNELYNFAPSEQSFKGALDYVEECSTRDSNHKLDLANSRRQKLDREIVKLGHRVKKQQKDMSRFWVAKVKELEARRDADESNKDIEAALHMAKNTSKIMYNGKQWYAIVDVPSFKTEVTVSVEQKWVEERFHKAFLAFMGIYGKVGGYTELDEAVEFQTDDPSGACKVVAVEYRCYFQKEPPTEAYYLHFKRVSNQADQADVPLQIERVSQVWLWAQLAADDISLDSTLLNARDRCRSGKNNSGNCPCFEMHTDSQHKTDCYRWTIVELDEDDVFTFHQDKRQMHSIKWNNAHQKWQGLCKTMHSGPDNEVVDLTEEWINENFSVDLIESFKDKGNRERVFVKIPPGAPRSDNSFPDSLKVLDAPIIVYRQKTGYSCVTNGLANALHFLSHHALAQRLYDFGMSLTLGGQERHLTIIGMTREFMRKQGKQWTPYKLNHSISLTDRRTYPSETTPRLVVLEADDGDAGHSVTIAGNWIFDSNFSHALPLCRASFDHICSEGGSMVGFRIGYDFRRPIGVSSPTPQFKSMRSARKRQRVLFEEDAGVL